MQSSYENSIEFAQYFSGEKLIGDEYSPAEIEEWYADEEEGYAKLGASNRESYKYGYHALNALHGYKWLPAQEDVNILGFGSAYGDELLPLLPKAISVTIIDPSESFAVKEREGVPINYVKPVPTGELMFGDDTFDIITCLGVLHHIPNISFVIRELGRVLKPGGFALIREPIVNMGDWRKPRRGLTKRERGIPVHYFEAAVANSQMSIWRKSSCAFPLTPRIAKIFGVSHPFNSRVMVRCDQFLSRATEWNIRYNRRTIMQKFCPTSFFWICKSTK